MVALVAAAGDVRAARLRGRPADARHARAPAPSSLAALGPHQVCVAPFFPRVRVALFLSSCTEQGKVATPQRRCRSAGARSCCRCTCWACCATNGSRSCSSCPGARLDVLRSSARLPASLPVMAASASSSAQGRKAACPPTQPIRRVHCVQVRGAAGAGAGVCARHAGVAQRRRRPRRRAAPAARLQGAAGRGLQARCAPFPPSLRRCERLVACTGKAFRAHAVGRRRERALCVTRSVPLA